MYNPQLAVIFSLEMSANCAHFVKSIINQQTFSHKLGIRTIVIKENETKVLTSYELTLHKYRKLRLH